MSEGEAKPTCEFHILFPDFLTEGWTVGSAYSVVDPFLLVLYRWGLAIEKPMAADHPNWTRHFERLMEREAVQTALAREARDSGR